MENKSKIRESFESTLHQYCVNLIEAKKKIMVRGISATLTINEDSPNPVQMVLKDKPKMIEFTDVQKERPYIDIRPDLTCFIYDQQIFIEIIVTSDLSEEKKEKLKQYGVTTLLIYVPKEKMQLYEYHREKFDDWLLNSAEKQYWHNNPKSKYKYRLAKEALKNLTSIFDDIEIKI
jgi:hypothetical protein